MPALALALASLGVAITIGMAWREARRAARARAGCLDACLALSGRLDIAPDGFPRFIGTVDGRAMRLRLMADTLTVKRLPQLWLVIDVPTCLVTARLAVIVRPRGDEFISSAAQMPGHLPVPAEFPADCAVRGEGPKSRRLLERLGPTLADLLADPRVKEVALEPSRLRLVFQAAEGRRDSHLLLRQARFETMPELATILHLRSRLIAIETALVDTEERVAA